MTTLRRPLPRATTVLAVCPHDCPDTCSLSVTIDDAGRAVKLRGNPAHEFTHGFLCPKVNHYLKRVYHPGRLTHPLRRTGPKGRGQFERTTWDEALDDIAARWKAIIASPDGPQAILPYSYAGTMGRIQGASLDRRFFHVLGASLLDRTICASAGTAGSEITLGAGRRPAIDPLRAVDCRVIVNWGSNTSVTNMHFWRLEHEARKQGAKIITIDPYRSPTAAKSDVWLPIRPGTDAALALGVMHIIFRDGLDDHDYWTRHATGGELLRQRVMKDYPPERVAGITGLGIAEIEAFAHDYGDAKRRYGGPALVRLNYGLQRHGGGGMAVRVVTCLPAITGDWRYPGAGAFLSTSRLYGLAGDALERPDLIPPGTRTINMVQLAEALHHECGGPPVRALYVYNSNPAAVAPDQSRVLSGLARDDLFTVVHEQFLTDTARYADYVLPATTQLEHFDLHHSYGHLDIQANAPAIAPLAECVPNTEVFRRLARRFAMPAELFALGDEDLARLALGENGPQPSVLDGITLDTLLDGPRRLNLPADFAPYAEGGFGTADGKCALYSHTEAAAGRDPLPTYTPPHEDPQTRPDLAAQYPLQLLTPPHTAFLNSTFVNIDHLRQLAGEPTLEMHPADAALRGLTDGQPVRISNNRGSFRAKLMIGDTVRPGVVVSLGLWWQEHITGGNVNATTSTRLTDFGGGATFFDNLVEVSA